VKAVRTANKVTGDHLSPGMERVIGELLGTGANLGLAAMAGSGIPGVSTIGALGGMVSGAVGFISQPKVANSHPLLAVRNNPSALHIASRPLGVRSGITVNRSHFLPQLMKSGESQGTVALSPDVQVRSFEHGADVSMGTCDGHMESVRVFVGQLPIAATYGDIIASFPLDLLTSVLKSTKAAYIAHEWDLVCWCAASLIYFPTAAATEAGGLIAVSSPDPTRSLAGVAASERVRAAFEYGPDMLASNLWSDGMAMRIEIDEERKYQSFKTALDSDEALKLGGAGRVEVICSGTYSGTNSPGMLAMDLDLMFLDQVSIEATGPSPANGGICSRAEFYNVSSGATTPTWASDGSQFSNHGLFDSLIGPGNAYGPLPFSGHESGTGNAFNAMLHCTPGEVNTSTGGGYVKNSAPVKGGLAALGWRYIGFTGGGAYKLAVPPGEWFITVCFGSDAGDSGSFTIAREDGVAVPQDIGSAPYGTGRLYRLAATISSPAIGCNLLLSRLARVTPTSSATASVYFSCSAGRIRSTSTRNPLIDHFAALQIVHSDPLFYDDEIDSYIVDQAGHDRDMVLKKEMATTLYDAGHIARATYDGYMKRLNKLSN